MTVVNSQSLASIPSSDLTREDRVDAFIARADKIALAGRKLRGARARLAQHEALANSKTTELISEVAQAEAEFRALTAE